MVQVYLPSLLLVMLSWLSFWIDREAILERVSLGSLCVVSIITHTTGLMSAVPQVTGIRAMDVWEATCVCLIFTAMLEFAFVHTLLRVSDKQKRAATPEQEAVNSFFLSYGSIL